ncbi:MAG: response regulator [Acidimicrobiales bacterium]
MSSALVEEGGDREGIDLARAPILIVDDREENLITLEAVVEPLGHPVIKATSGQEALRVLLREDVAVILLDVQMPELDGFETAAHIKQRERTRQIPIIFLTAISADTGNMLRGYAEGAVDYLTKPFDPDVLRSKVAVFLELHRARCLLQEQARMLEERLREREVVEEALRETAADLARSNAELEQFAAVVAHDLQAPLVTNAGLIAVVLEDYGAVLPPEVVDLLQRVDRNREGMRQLIQSLLAWSQASLAPLRHAVVKLDDVLQEVLEACAAAIGIEHAEVQVGPLPIVTGDHAQLAELFQNLLTNALKFHRPDRPPKIEITGGRDESGVLVSVADDGVGISADRRADVFSMFSRLGSKHPGRGIGLAVCHRIVERHGGRIWMDGRDGGGTVANVWLPGPA